MHEPLNLRQISIRSAALTALFLFGGLLLGFLAAFWLTGLPMHLPESTRVLLGFTIIMSVVVAAGALWGRAIARLCQAGEPRRTTWAGALTFGPALLLAALALGRLERLFVEEGGGPDLPVHNVFTVLFVPAVFFVAGAVGLAVGLAQREARIAWRCALGSGLAGSAAFLVVNLAMDSLGWRIGAPGAAERATMLTVMMAGNLGASLAGGAALGALLAAGIRERIRGEV
jgi:hypothetical protein